MGGKRPPGRWFGPCHVQVNIIQISVFIAFYCDYVLNSMGVPILPTYLAKLDISEKYIGILFAAKPAVQIFANTIAGVLVDKGGAKPILLLGLAVLAVSTAVFGIGLTFNLPARITYGFLLIARIVQGLSSAAIMSAGMTWIARTHTSARRGVVMGFVLIGIGAGAVSGATFGGVLASFFGNASPFFVVAVLLGVDAILILTENTTEVIAEDPTPEDNAEGGAADQANTKKPSERSQMFGLLKDYTILCINILLFTGNAGMTILQPTLPIYVHAHLKFDQFGQGLMWGVMTFTYLISRPLSGIVADRFAKWIVISIGVALLATGLSLVGSGAFLYTMLLGICCVGAGVGFITTPCMPLLADIVEMRGSQGYGIVYSMADISTSLGMIIGPLMGSLLYSLVGFNLTCHIGGAMCLASMGCANYLKHLAPKTPQKEGERENTDDETPMVEITHTEGVAPPTVVLSHRTRTPIHVPGDAKA